MSLITLNSDIEQHYLQSEFDRKPTLIEEPIGWKKSDKQIKRSKDSGEIITKNAKNVKFVKTGREYILSIERIYGSNTKVRYTIVKENPLDSMDFYKDVYFLDLPSLKDKNGVLAIKIEEGGLSKLIKSKQSQKYEFDRTTDVKGNIIELIKKKIVLLDGRRIFLKSILDCDSESFETRSSHKGIGGKTVKRYAPFPVKVVNNSHFGISTPQLSVQHDRAHSQEIFITDCFLRLNDRDKRIKIDFDLYCVVRKIKIGYAYDKVIQLRLVTYENGLEMDIKETLVIQDISIDTVYSHIFSKTIDLKKDESLSLQFCTSAKVGNNFGNHRGWWSFKYENCTGEINIEEDSFIEETVTDVVYYHELCQKLTEIITGDENLFYSELFGSKDMGYEKDGKYSGLTVSNGLWIRGFVKRNEKKPSITLKDALDSANALCGIGWMVEKIGFKERFRIESLDFFYQNTVTIELPNIVEDLEISIANDFIYNSYEVGYEKGGTDYEEATGVGEYNGKAEFSNILETVDKKLKVLSKIRGDSSMTEFARRKHKKFGYAQEDTKYDLDNVFIDTKKGNTDVLLQRKWQDDLETQPTGIYDPDSATMLRFTPQKMLRNARKLFLSSSLFQYANTYIRFNSSNCNSELETNTNGQFVKENNPVKVSELGHPRFKMYWATFTHKVDFYLSKKLRGKSIINGKEIYNFYGIVKYKTSENEYQYGYIFEVKENGKGKWKVLTANR